MFNAIPLRTSRRSYTGVAVESAHLHELAEIADRWRPWPGARCVIIAEAPQSVFLGIIGSYGGVSKAPSAIAFIGSDPQADEGVGYTGEGLVLAAAARGLDTCWLGGVFGASAVADLVPLATHERVVGVSALGHALDHASLKERIIGAASHRGPRRSLDEVAPGHSSWPSWARSAIEAVRPAPSARNVQPWRFRYAEGLVVSYVGRELPGPSKRLDCGIAMLHAELGALAAGVTGEWETLASPDVAVFRPTTG